MRRLSFARNIEPVKDYVILGYGSAEEQVADEQAALAAGMTFADWQVQKIATLEQEIIGRYNSALAALGSAGLDLQNVEEGNALIAFLIENQSNTYDDKDIIDLVMSIRGQIQDGTIPETIAFEEVGRDVRPALFNMIVQPTLGEEVKKKIAMLLQVLEHIRELFYIQMINALQGKPRDLEVDAKIQKDSEKAKGIAKEIGLAIETNYTLQMLDKSERLVAENLDTIQFGQDEHGYIFKSTDSIVDQAMAIISAKSELAEKAFDEYVSKPAQRKALQYGFLGLLLGFLFANLRKGRKK